MVRPALSVFRNDWGSKEGFPTREGFRLPAILARFFTAVSSLTAQPCRVRRNSQAKRKGFPLYA
jgi:hypothetical protein